MTQLPEDPTLDEIRAHLAPRLPAHAAFDGWSAEALARAAEEAGVDRITALVWARIETLAPEREALRRSLAILALPTNAFRAGRMGWRAADLMWRLAGDTSVDYNHYTKRTLLSGVYASTVLALLADETTDLADTRAFLDRRIGDVMKIEKAKAEWLGRGRHRPSLSRFVGRLRYPVG